jgi:hypothetical protein
VYFVVLGTGSALAYAYFNGQLSTLIFSVGNKYNAYFQRWQQITFHVFEWSHKVTFIANGQL